MNACFQIHKILAAVSVLTLLACSDGTVEPAVQPNLVDALDLPRSSERAAVADLVADADAYYALYSDSGSHAYYERHWSAAEGARLLLEQEDGASADAPRPEWDLEDLFDMPTGTEADELADMPFGRA